MNEDNNTQLPEILAPLTEKMARQVHITWMQGRLDEGWTFGPVRDDRLKTHPCLVEYDELPEREREYDRRTAAATIQFILANGFDIIPR